MYDPGIKSWLVFPQHATVYLHVCVAGGGRGVVGVYTIHVIMYSYLFVCLNYSLSLSLSLCVCDVYCCWLLLE